MDTGFKVLGPLEVWHDGRPVPLPAGKARVLLAALLLRANRIVTTDELVELLWPGASTGPARSRASLQMVVTRLRRSLGEASVVRTATNGYVADVPEGALDLDRFRDLVKSDRFAEALVLWRGSPLPDVPSDALHAELVAPLVEEHLVVVERRIDADLEAGRSAELVAELRLLTKQHPLRERFWAQLMTALVRSDQRAEALAAYRALSDTLAEELGVDPGSRLQELHQRILTTAPDAPGSPAPRQLPRDTPFFVGRERESAALSALLDSAATGAGAVVISAINGTAGIGKTALALHWAVRNRRRFPDGQLYVDLRGFDAVKAPMPSDVAVRGFLGALGVTRERIPATVDEQVGLYRSLLADRRVLVVLDNAIDSEQVRPLLPSGSGCFAVVTSRNQLDGLVVREGARSLTLAVLGDAESTALLEHQLGADRVAAEPDAVLDVIRHCAGLPLALSVVAARAAAHPEFPLRVLADELADERTRLAALDTGDTTTSVRAVFSWSYDRLSPVAARLFGLLGLHPGPDVTIPAAASLAGMRARETRTIMGELSRMHLVTEHLPGRYRLHDLVSAYARDVATAADAQEAVARLLDHYAHTAEHADRVLYPQREPVHLAPIRPRVIVERVESCAAARDWYRAELRNLVAAVEHAADHGFTAHAWQIAHCTASYLHASGQWSEWLEVCRKALGAAERLPDVRGQAHLHRGLGRANTLLHRWEEADDHLHTALRLFLGLGDKASAGYTLINIAGNRELRGLAAEALPFSLRALELFRELGHLAGQARALTGAGYDYHLLERYEDATRFAKEAIGLYGALTDLPGLAAATDNLGLAHRESGRLDDAVVHQRRAGELFAQAGERYYEAGNWRDLGETYRRMGDLDAARDALRNALAAFEELLHPDADAVRARLEALRPACGRPAPRGVVPAHPRSRARRTR